MLRLPKTKKQFRQLGAAIEANTKTQTMTPNAGAIAGVVRNVAFAGATFALSAPVGSPRYSIASGAIPVGMSLNPVTGLLNGTPTAPAASYNFSIRGTDQHGNSKVNAYTMAVAAS